MTTDDDDQRVRDALVDMSFPAQRSEVIEYAAAREETARVRTALDALPDRTFSTVDDVVISVPQHADLA